MHDVHAFQEWLIPADFPGRFFREPQREALFRLKLRKSARLILRKFFPRHCEERRDEAIQSHKRDIGLTTLDCFASLAMTG